MVEICKYPKSWREIVNIGDWIQLSSDPKDFCDSIWQSGDGHYYGLIHDQLGGKIYAEPIDQFKPLIENLIVSEANYASK